MPALDGLRGVAILMVVMIHASMGMWGAVAPFREPDPGMAMLALPYWLERITSSGALGVQLFFVISAFTLTVNASRGRGDLRSYALRRIARVGPGYWIAGLIYMLVVGLGPRPQAPDGVGLVDVVVAALFGTAWQGGAAFAVVPGGWSVCCEVMFYLALPLLIRLIDFQVWRAVALTVFTVVVAQFRQRHAPSGSDLDALFFYTNPIEQAPVFLCGMTAAMIALRWEIPKAPGTAILLLLVAIVALPFQPIAVWHLMPHMIFAPLVAVVVALSAAHPPRLLANPWMRKIGDVSYSMYLVHFAFLVPTIYVAEWLFPASDWRTLVVHFGLAVTLSFVASCWTRRMIEQPPIDWARDYPRNLGIATAAGL